MKDKIRLRTDKPYSLIEGNQFIGNYITLPKKEANKILKYKQVKEVKEEKKKEKKGNKEENLNSLTVVELRELAKEEKVSKPYELNKSELIKELSK